MNNKIIDFNDILNIFNNKQLYHIGYLTAQQVQKIRNFPIKEMPVDDLQKPVNDLLQVNGICLLIVQNRAFLNRHTQEHMHQCLKQLIAIPGIITDDFIKLAKKPAMVEAGLGQYGKNQVVFDEFFGFDSQVDTWFIFNPVINLPKQKPPKWGYLSICTGCTDCYNACPGHAIHNQEEPAWVDKDACRHFCGVGTHPTIKTLKYKLNDIFNNPPFPKEIVDNLKSQEEVERLYGIKWEGERFYRDKDGTQYFVNADICRECCSQPKCSRWGGHYQYNDNVDSFILKENVEGKY